MTTPLRFLAPLAVLVAFASAALAQDSSDEAKVVAVELTPKSVGPGAEISLRVEVEVGPGYHIYGLTSEGLPTKFEPPKGGWPANVTAGTPTESPKSSEGPEKTLIHSGTVSFTLPLKIDSNADPGTVQFTLGLMVQTCDDRSCLLPATLPVEVKFDVEPAVRIVKSAFVAPTAAAGGEAALEIEFAIAKGWHLYAQKQETELPPKFKWTLPPDWTASGPLVEVTPPHDAKLYGLDEVYSIHEGRLVLRQVFHVPAAAKPGRYEVRGVGDYQHCNDVGCISDKDVPVQAAVEVVPAGAAPAKAPVPLPPPPAPPPPAPKDDPAPAPAEEGGQSLGDVLLAGMGWGFITILTPCVFPLLPVTVSFFSKQKGPALPRSLVYSAGIIFTLTVIGLIFKGSLDIFSRGSAFNLFVGVLFIVLALSLFGLFELRLPSFLIDKSQERGSSGGLAGAFFMAVTLALTSFSCSVPFLAIMFSSFDKGHQVNAVLGLLAYSSVVALPFFLCSLFPALLKTLPRSGGWLNAIKVTMGFVEFGLAFKFLRTVALNMGSSSLPSELVIALWAACALGAALYLLGFIVLPHDTKSEHIGVIRLLFALMFLMISFFLLPGVFGRPLGPWLDGFLQREFPAQTARVAGPGGAAAEAPEIEWGLNDWDGALARGRKDNRAVLFDFTGVG